MSSQIFCDYLEMVLKNKTRLDSDEIVIIRELLQEVIDTPVDEYGLEVECSC